jgi:predicted DCC family thiol-disulfide oxidoreductase YuxK
VVDKHALSVTKRISPYQFAAFRMVLGLYLAVHFACLIPYASELFGPKSVVGDGTLNLTYGVFPNVLYLLSTAQIQGLLVILSLLSLALACGLARPLISLVLWYGWVCLFDHNTLMLNPGLTYVGWILLILAAVPRGEPLSLFKSTKEGWQFPPLLYWGAWALMLAGYSVSGVDKFMAPSWRNGEAIIILLDNPLARDWFVRDLFHMLPEFFLKLMTWSVLAIEIISLPMLFHRTTRKIIWFLLLTMHLGILLIVDFADLTLGMLMIHFLTFDASWLKPRKAETQILFFDGVCGLCNSTVDLLMSEDHAATIKYAALQGSTAQEKLDPSFIADLDSMVYLRDGKTWTKSSGVLRALRDVGGFWRVFYILIIIPAPLRDGLYSIVAKYRYRWFGKSETCRMPTPDERARLLN